MKRLGAVLLTGAFFCATGSVLPMRAIAADTWQNPFCNGLVYVVPWNTVSNSPSVKVQSDRYLLSLWANGRTDVAASVTLITSTDAYSVPIKRTSLLREGGTDDYYAEPILVSFDKPVDVGFAYVDQIGVDGAAPAACPSVVQSVKPFAVDPAHPFDMPSVGSDVTPIAATYLQPLPSLKCGHVYSDAEIEGSAPLVGHYGDRRRSTVVDAFIDSDGRAAKVKIEESSGVEGLDDAALGGVQQAQFKPAEFLCTPVVSEMSVRMDYDP